ncbi:MBL fold metallo-hydrolase [Flammeovirgaceae bacterium SG7u.111]|nr:MBL fold metallo-hydrolase [Flammeovirgaceae bacterium SG7u.132]WPO35533.1 MBL fold metallo-hydrolase [Flammeovirgaceae bacterium SG7u.111]
MKVVIKLIKKIGAIVGILLLLLAVIGGLFVNISPEFGGEHNEERIKIYSESGHYKEGKFENLIPTSMDMDFFGFIGVMGEFIKGNPTRQPKGDIPVNKMDSISLVNSPKSLTRIYWFGHSAFLLEIEGKNILIDPMLGETPSPVPFMGAKRYSRSLPIEIEKLPKIDAVILSHDHYDHLDYGSILKLKAKVSEFYMPLGVGAHLKEWGVDEEKIHELNWWDTISLDSLAFTCAPSRHFSGRGLTDRFTTLWGSWIIQSPTQTIYFSGDGGYGPHFKEIGEKYGPFDFAMMECGQYNKQWANIHMMPEETAQASVDLQAKMMMPIHWGAFTLALHSWTDPIERVSVKAKELGMPMTTPQIGEPIILNENIFPNSKWWKGIE